LELLINRYCCI